MERHVLTGDTDIAAPDSSIANQPSGDEPGCVARNGKADALRRANHGRVHADYFPRGIDERAAGIARVQCRVGLDDVVNQAARLRLHRPPERADHARGYARLETERISNRDRQLANAQALGIRQAHMN